MKFHVICAVAMAGLAGCSDGASDGLTLGFAAPDSAGTIGRLDEIFVSNTITSNLTGNAFAYEVGSVSEDGFHGYAGLLPGASVQAPPTSGQTVFTGVFYAGLIGDVRTDAEFVYGTPREDTGVITMSIDYGLGTMTATGRGTDDPADTLLNGNRFEANGAFSGTQMTGTVTYNGISGPMEGLMGADEAMGVFHGESATQLHAGGFGASP